MHCIFCDIVRGAASAEILTETPHALAILDINPIHYGHALVLPKQHRVTFIDIPPDELCEIIQTMQVVSRAIVHKFRPEGFNIFSNNGLAAGQSVFHCHFHITPRYHDDNIQFVLKLKRYSGNGLAEYGDALRGVIREGAGKSSDLSLPGISI